MPPKIQALADLKLPRAGAGSHARRAQRLSTLPPAGLVLGVDPGLLRTGWGVIATGASRPAHCVAAGVLRAPATAALAVRLAALHGGLTELLQEQQPHVVVIEELFSNYRHPRSALLMAHARGVLLLAAEQAGVPVHSFLPNEVKQVIAGDGHASKEAMQRAVQSRLKLKEIPQPHDAADALALALCFALRQNVKRE